MGNKKKDVNKGSGPSKRLRNDESFLTSTPNSDLSVNMECERPNANSILSILETVKSMQGSLQSVQSSIESINVALQGTAKSVSDINERLCALEVTLPTLVKDNSELKAKVMKQDGDIAALNLEIFELKNSILKLDNIPNELNFIFWGLHDMDLAKASSLITNVLSKGLEFSDSDIPKFEVLKCGPKFVKVKVPTLSDKTKILRNAKKLKGKCLSTFSNIFITDDVPPRVRAIRRDLVGHRKLLLAKGVEAWIPPVIPPIICIRDKDSSIKKVKWYEVKNILRD